MNKAELIAAAKLQWTKSEASIGKAARGNFDAQPADGGWSAADIYRHMVDTAHKLPEGMQALIKEGNLGSLQPGDEEGIKNFASLNARMLPVEMNTAHGIDWMALQTLTDKQLEQSVNFNGNDIKLGDLLPMFLIMHEQMHVEQALAAAGVA